MKRLFIRSIQVELFNNLFENVNNDKIPTDVLDNRKQTRNLNKKFNKIYLTKKIGNYNFLNIEIKKIIQIRNEKYDELYFFHKQAGTKGLENLIILSILLNSKKIYHLKYDPYKLNLNCKVEIKKTKLIVLLLENIFVLLLMPLGIVLTLFCFITAFFKWKKKTS